MPSQNREHLTIPPDGQPEAGQPRWRRDFPIAWPEDNYVARRDFTKFMVLTSLAFVAGQFWILLQNFLRKHEGTPRTYEIARVDELPIGGSRVFNYSQEHTPCVLIRLDADRFVAYSQQCTHLTCPVIPQPEAGRLYCPCHVGVFDLVSGRPIAGPPRRALPRVKLEIRRGTIYAHGWEEAAL